VEGLRRVPDFFLQELSNKVVLLLLEVVGFLLGSPVYDILVARELVLKEGLHDCLPVDPLDLVDEVEDAVL
jgi:hypothetical protein